MELDWIEKVFGADTDRIKEAIHECISEFILEPKTEKTKMKIKHRLNRFFEYLINLNIIYKYDISETADHHGIIIYYNTNPFDVITRICVHI